MSDSKPPDGSKPRILIVDDVECVQLMYRQAFADQGYELRFSKFGGDALDQWRTWRPQLIILDIKLPDMTGIQVLAKIRATDPATPVIMSTAFNMADMVRQAAEYGITHFLAKPVDIDDMLLRVGRILGTVAAPEPATARDREALLKKSWAALKQDAAVALKLLIAENEEEVLKLSVKELLDEVIPLEAAVNAAPPDGPALLAARSTFALRSSRVRRTLRNLEGKNKPEKLLGSFRTLGKSLADFLEATAFLAEGDSAPADPGDRAGS